MPLWGGLSLGMGSGAAGSNGPPFPAGATFLLKADQGLAVGSKVASWPDQSGNGNNYINGTQATQPTCTAGAGPKANLPAVVFTSASSQLLIASGLLVPTKNFTVCIVGKVTSTAAAQDFLAVGNGSNGWAIGVDINATSARDFNAAGVTAVSGPAATTSWEAWVFQSDASGNLTLLVNNASQALAPTAATATETTGQSVLGSFNGSSAFLNGSIYIAAAWPFPLSAGQLAQLNKALSYWTGLF